MLLLFTFLPCPAAGQTSLTVRARSPQEEGPVQGVEVEVTDSRTGQTFKLTTDSAGNATLPRTPSGDLNVTRLTFYRLAVYRFPSGSKEGGSVSAAGDALTLPLRISLASAHTDIMLKLRRLEVRAVDDHGPVSGAAVQLLGYDPTSGKEGKQILFDTSDSSGIAVFYLPEGKLETRPGQAWDRTLIFVKKEGSATKQPESIPPSSWNLEVDLVDRMAWFVRERTAVRELLRGTLGPSVDRLDGVSLNLAKCDTPNYDANRITMPPDIDLTYKENYEGVYHEFTHAIMEVCLNVREEGGAHDTWLTTAPPPKNDPLGPRRQIPLTLAWSEGRAHYVGVLLARLRGRPTGQDFVSSMALASEDMRYPPGRANPLAVPQAATLPGLCIEGEIATAMLDFYNARHGNDTQAALNDIMAFHLQHHPANAQEFFQLLRASASPTEQELLDQILVLYRMQEPSPNFLQLEIQGPSTTASGKSVDLSARVTHAGHDAWQPLRQALTLEWRVEPEKGAEQAIGEGEKVTFTPTDPGKYKITCRAARKYQDVSGNKQTLFSFGPAELAMTVELTVTLAVPGGPEVDAPFQARAVASAPPPPDALWRWTSGGRVEITSKQDDRAEVVARGEGTLTAELILIGPQSRVLARGSADIKPVPAIKKPPKEKAEAAHRWLQEAVAYLQELLDLDDEALRRAERACGDRHARDLLSKNGAIYKGLTKEGAAHALAMDVLEEQKRRKCMVAPTDQHFDHQRDLKATLRAIQDSRLDLGAWQEYSGFGDYDGYLKAVDALKAQFKVKIPEPVPRPAALPWSYSAACSGDQSGVANQVTVKLTAAKSTVKPGEKLALTAEASGGNPPYTFSWSLDPAADGPTFMFASRTAGPRDVTVTATDSAGKTGTASLRLTVSNYTCTITGKPTSVTVGAPVHFEALLLEEGKPASGTFTYRWQPHPEVKFDRLDDREPTVTARFPGPGRVGVWVQVLEKDASGTLVTVTESDPFEIEVTKPQISMTSNPPDPLVGQEIRARVELGEPGKRPAEGGDARPEGPAEASELEKPGGPSRRDQPKVVVRWLPPPSHVVLVSESRDTREITLYLKEPKRADLQALVLNEDGDTLGEATVSVNARLYDVSVAGPKTQGAKPRVFKPGVGLVEVEGQMAVGQNLTFRAQVSPAPEKPPLRYRWSAGQGCSLSNDAVQEPTVTCSETGGYTLTVEVRDSRDVVLGEGSASFSVSLASMDGGTAGKSGALLDEARKLIKDGKYAPAADKVAEAEKADPGAAAPVKTELAEAAKKAGWEKLGAYPVPGIDEAISLFDLAVKLNPGDADGKKKLTQAKQARDSYQKMQALFATLKSQLAEYRVVTGYETLKAMSDNQQGLRGSTGLLEEANRLYGAAQKEMNRWVSDHDQAWTECFKTRRWAEAVKVLEEALTRELVLSSERNYRESLDMARRNLAEQQAAWTTYQQVKADWEAGRLSEPYKHASKIRPDLMPERDERVPPMQELLAALSQNRQPAGAGPPPCTVAPATGAQMKSRRPEVGATFQRPVKTDTVRLTLDGREVTSQAQVTNAQVRYQPGSDLEQGEHHAELSAVTGDGQSFHQEWSFQVTAPATQPAAAPTCTVAPPDGSSSRSRRPEVGATFAQPMQPASVQLVVDGRDVTSSSIVNNGQVRFLPGADLSDGGHEASLTATSADGQSLSQSWSFSVSGPAAPPPPPPAASPTCTVAPAPGASSRSPRPEVGATFAQPMQPSSIRLSVDGRDVTGSSMVNNGQVRFQPTSDLSPGSHTASVTATSASGQPLDRRWSFDVEGPAAPPPPPPTPGNPPPQCTVTPPTASLFESRPEVGATFDQPMQPATVRLVLDGRDVTGSSIVNNGQVRYQPSSNLARGQHSARVTALAMDGQRLDQSWSFAISGPIATPPPSTPTPPTRPPTPPTTPTRPPATPPTSSGGMQVDAVFENRDSQNIHIFVEGDSFGPHNRLTPGEKRHVMVRVPASGRVKIYAGRGGQVLSTKNWDTDPSDASRYPHAVYTSRGLSVTTGLR